MSKTCVWGNIKNQEYCLGELVARALGSLVMANIADGELSQKQNFFARKLFVKI